MFIKKVKHTTSGLSVEFNHDSNIGSITSTVSSDNEAPDFTKALAALKPLALSFCELPEGSQCHIKTISYSYHGDENMPAAIMSISKKLNSGLIMNLNTPLNYFHAPSDKTPSSQVFPEELTTQLSIVMEQAKKFTEGFRSQTDMFE